MESEAWRVRRADGKKRKTEGNKKENKKIKENRKIEDKGKQ